MEHFFVSVEAAAINSVPFERKGCWVAWKIISLISAHRWTAAVLGVLVLLTAGFDIAVPLFSRSLVDAIVNSLRSGRTGSIGVLVTTVVLIFSTTAATRFVRFLYRKRLFRFAVQSQNEMKAAVSTDLLRHNTEPTHVENRSEVGGLADRRGKAVFVLLYYVIGQALFPYVFVVVGALTILLVCNMRVAIIVYLPIAVYGAAIARMQWRMHWLSGPGKVLARFIAITGRLAVLAFGGYLVVNQRCTLGEYALFIAMQDMVYAPVCQLPSVLPKLRRELLKSEPFFWAFQPAKVSLM